MKIKPEVAFILNKALLNKEINLGDAIKLMKIDNNSHEMYALMSTANTLSIRQFANRGEVYAQVGINLWPCPKSCAFCSFGEKWHLFNKRLEFSIEEVVDRVKAFENAGANAIFLMTTADYPFDKYLEIAKAVRRVISPGMPMVANIGDFNAQQAEELLNTGFQGAYHVCRLREGKDSEIDKYLRLSTLETIKDSDLDLGYCVEPIGPEHTPEELVDEMFRGKEYGAINHASMWRVPIPVGPLSHIEKISQVTLAKAISVTRLIAGDTIRAMGVHEARILPLRAGANQIYAETGPNPRDKIEDTSRGIGFSVKSCRNLLKEAGLVPLEGPTKVFQGRFSSFQL